ncbi:hypothetical protein AR505_0847 [methanogenic archaeon ISO4-H5]|nr:hypothetical protein AR505_0847 [methanogenic archaeon ISO4-H5]
MRICEHKDLIELYENPIEHACDMKVGFSFVSKNAEKPDGMCDPAWSVIRKCVSELANCGGNFFEISSVFRVWGKRVRHRRVYDQSSRRPSFDTY